MLGTVGSGKSTIGAAIVLTAQTLSGLRPNFFCRVLENQSDILADASNLRRGRFPKKTPAYTSYPPEAGLLMIWQGGFREKKVQIPVCDIAGEDLQQMIYQAKIVSPLGADAFLANQRLIDYVKDSDGFILAVPASRALMFHDNVSLESEPLEADPDVNLTRILTAVINHKEQSRGKPIKGIAVVITKWDLIAPYASNWGMDLYDPSGQGLTKFMEVCFPATSMTLKSAKLADRLQFFPSHIQVARTDDGLIKKWPDSTDRVEVIQERRVPKYSEQSYVNLFEWLRTFAT